MKLILGATLVILCFNKTYSQRLRNCFIPTPIQRPCNASQRYRTINGACNNVLNKSWGTPGAELVRLVSANYHDGIGEPRGGIKASKLPNPRRISQRNHPDNDNPDTRYTMMVMQFGQFLDHDITVTPKDETVDCCKEDESDSRCFYIPIPDRDKFYSWVNYTATCLNMVRSTPFCTPPQGGVREQFNGITSFIDASNVYGSEIAPASFIRTYTGGELIINKVTKQLPTREQLNLRPEFRRVRKPEKQTDFVAGDSRANEHPFLSVLHIVFLREHNRIARELRKYLPDSLQKDETIYQETRRLVGGEMQNIVYGEFLPTILGKKYMHKYNLLAEDNSKYDPGVNPNVINSFTAAAFRFGHSMINSMFMLVEKSKKIKSFWKLREIFDGNTIEGSKLPLEDMLEGLISQMPQTTDAFFSTEITNHLFQKNQHRENFGLDLLAINIQRGRDHGLPGYNQFRKYCGMKPLTSWSRKPSEFNAEYWAKLKEVYESASLDSIDLMVGGVAEANVRGGAVGPTFACIIGEQFRRLKYGDRFFYTHVQDRNYAKGMSEVVKSYVLNRTLGDVLCDNTELNEIQKWVTLQPDEGYNPQEACSSKTKMDMSAIAQEIVQELTGTPSTGQREPKGPSRFGRAMHPGVLSLLCLTFDCTNQV